MEWNHDITTAPRGKMVKKTRHVPTKTGGKGNGSLDFRS